MFDPDWDDDDLERQPDVDRFVRVFYGLVLATVITIVLILLVRASPFGWFAVGAVAGGVTWWSYRDTEPTDPDDPWDWL